MDISKILDFHQKVMMSMGDKPSEDETVCGPLCQHPACWDSNRRRERGVPRINTLSSTDSDSDSDLPTVKYYNMLEDFGDSPKDRFPARFGGRALHERSSSMKNLSDPLTSPSIALTTAPFATPVSPEKMQHPLMPQPMRLVEVQEVFDKADLNSRWDETFMTRQYLVWVPNPKKRIKKKSEATPRTHEETKTPRSLLPKDLTELMVPLEIKKQREESVLFDEWPVLKKKQARSQSPLFWHGTYPRTPNSAIKPDVDAEGYDFYEIGERILSSDFVSREKIHGIIEEVLSTARDRCNFTGRDASPRRSAIDTSNVLRQQKLQLHHSTQRHVRSSYTMSQQPVFQLDDDDDKSSVDSVRGRAASDIESTQGRYLKGLPHFKNTLPGIAADQAKLRRELVPRGKKQEKRKIPSVSLGLPELPSGLRQTRAFTYNNQHRPDFTLVPVPTPPTSVRSSGSLPSDHGTTMRVNLPSVSDLQEDDYYDREPIGLLSTDRTTQEGGALHLVSPALSSNVPIAPASTPATFQSPTKSLMYRDFTATSSMQAGNGVRSMPPSRDITMSPGHKISIPTTGPVRPGTSGSAEDQGLDTIHETTREHGTTSSMKSSVPGQTVQFAKPAPHLSSPSYGLLTAKVGDQSLAKGEADGTHPTQQGKDISPDYWPQVTESNYDMASGMVGSNINFMTEQNMLAEHGSLQRGLSDLNSRGSNHSSLARRILDESAKQVVESPAPPPPSPEPKEQLDRKQGRNKRESKSRESSSMEPLLELSESEGSSSPQKSLEKKSAKSKSFPIEPVIKEELTPTPQPTLDLAASSDNFDPVSKVMVFHVAPQPYGSREKLQQTFMNVDIPAEDISSLHAEQKSSGALDFTSSVAASPEKMSPMKGVSSKSSPGLASPVKKSPGKPIPKKTGSGGKRGDKKNGKEKRVSPAPSPDAEKSGNEEQ